MKAVRLLALLVVGAMLCSQNASGQQAAVPKLTLAQVEDLVSHGVPDSTMSTQIQRRGLAFAPTPAIVESLRVKGAGSQTLAAIEALFPKPKPIVPKKVSITADVARSLLLQMPTVAYPPIAKAARISGTVELRATISETGSVEVLEVVSGPAMLQQAALDAVRQWQYKPYLVNNKPAEVETTVNVIFTLGTDTPQSNTGAKPAASDSGPSLAATMQFIQDKLNERGSLKFAVHTHDNSAGRDYIDQYINEASNLIADPAACSISYHRTHKKNGAVIADADVSVSLHDVQDVVVMTAEQSWKLSFLSAGHSTWDARIDPPMFQVVARKAGNQGSGFYFVDEEMASCRMAGRSRRHP